ncbi:MAG: hypothetical protein ACP5UA_00930 [Candidatus Hydrogenedens sp.]
MKGAPLRSWYGGEYHPACMNHPDWRKYEKYLVKTSLEIGLDGIFLIIRRFINKDVIALIACRSFYSFLNPKGKRLKTPRYMP